MEKKRERRGWACPRARVFLEAVFPSLKRWLRQPGGPDSEERDPGTVLHWI